MEPMISILLTLNILLPRRDESRIYCQYAAISNMHPGKEQLNKLLNYLLKCMAAFKRALLQGLVCKVSFIISYFNQSSFFLIFRVF